MHTSSVIAYLGLRLKQNSLDSQLSPVNCPVFYLSKVSVSVLAKIPEPLLPIVIKTGSYSVTLYLLQAQIMYNVLSKSFSLAVLC